MNTVTRLGFCLCFELIKSIFRGGATALCWGRCAACLGYYDAFVTNGRAALRGESGCSPRKALPTALRSGWAAALSSRSVDIIAAGPSGVNKHAIHDYVRNRSAPSGDQEKPSTKKKLHHITSSLCCLTCPLSRLSLFKVSCPGTQTVTNLFFFSMASKKC